MGVQPSRQSPSPRPGSNSLVQCHHSELFHGDCRFLESRYEFWIRHRLVLAIYRLFGTIERPNASAVADRRELTATHHLEDLAAG